MITPSVWYARQGCRLSSIAMLAVSERSRKPMRSLYSRKAAMYRPACRISHTGVRSASARSGWRGAGGWAGRLRLGCAAAAACARRLHRSLHCQAWSQGPVGTVSPSSMAAAHSASAAAMHQQLSCRRARRRRRRRRRQARRTFAAGHPEQQGVLLRALDGAGPPAGAAGALQGPQGGAGRGRERGHICWRTGGAGGVHSNSEELPDDDGTAGGRRGARPSCG